MKHERHALMRIKEADFLYFLLVSRWGWGWARDFGQCFFFPSPEGRIGVWTVGAKGD